MANDVNKIATNKCLYTFSVVINSIKIDGSQQPLTISQSTTLTISQSITSNYIAV